jgi:hypothetical protein
MNLTGGFMVCIKQHGFPNSLVRRDALSDEKNLTYPSVSANRKEKNRLAAVSAALGLTISIWVAGFFMPENWLDTLSQAPAWLYCIVFVILWAILTEAMYFIFRTSRK